MDIFAFISLAGGLALFLYGMTVLGTGLEKMSGGRLERILEKLTSNVFKGVLLGALVTAAVQSSSATTVIIVGLVNAKILKLRQAIGVIMGANIGTTITAHILRMTQLTSDNIVLQILKPTTLAPLIAIVGVILFMTAKRSAKRDVGQMLLGFGILFTGMFQMEAAVRPLSDLPEFAEMFATLSNPVLGVLAGAVVTAIIQSSSASVGILQALSSTGAITYSSAFPIIMGQNIGTCITPIMASIGASKNAKRAAFVHLSFNILGTVFFLAITYAFQNIVGFAFWDDAIDSGGIANFHTVFNIAVTLAFIPFVGLMEKMACTFVKNSAQESDDARELLVLDERLMRSPGLAIEHSRKVAFYMADLARDNLAKSVTLINNYDPKVAAIIKENENVIDHTEDKLEAYLLNLAKRELTDTESYAISELLHVIGEFERIGDQAINVMEKAEGLFDSGNKFSEKGCMEIEAISAAVLEIVEIAVTAYRNYDYITAKSIEPLEEVIDLMEETLKAKHIRRLREGRCSVDAAFPFVETIASLEKTADYCSNIGVLIIGKHEKTSNRSFDPHEYLRKIHKGETEDYAENYKLYEQKYLTRIMK